jgi:hypothetical protein
MLVHDKYHDRLIYVARRCRDRRCWRCHDRDRDAVGRSGAALPVLPLKRFEQTRHATHRLGNYGVSALACGDIAGATHEHLADRIVDSLRQVPQYCSVETGGLTAPLTPTCSDRPREKVIARRSHFPA